MASLASLASSWTPHGPSARYVSRDRKLSRKITLLGLTHSNGAALYAQKAKRCCAFHFTIHPELRLWRRLRIRCGRAEFVVAGFRIEAAIVAELARFVGFDAFEEKDFGREVDLREERQPDAFTHARLLEGAGRAWTNRGEQPAR